MAFQLKNMLGHMIRPKQQAVAIASNNTDQMFYGAMAPVSPTMLAAQQQRIFVANSEATKMQQNNQQTTSSSQQSQQSQVTTASTNVNLVSQQNLGGQQHHSAQSARLAVTSVPAQIENQQHQTTYAMPQLSHRLLTANANGVASVAQFYLPPSANSEVHHQNHGIHHHHQMKFQQRSAAIPSQISGDQISQFMQQQTSHPVSNNSGNGPGYVDYHRHQQSQHPHQHYPHHNHHYQQFNDTPFGKPNYHHHMTASSANIPHNQNQTNTQQTAGNNHHSYGQNSSRTAFFNSSTPTVAQPYRHPNQQATGITMPMPMRKGVQTKVGDFGQNTKNTQNKTHSNKTSIEQQYFENEAEAQAWEDHCLGNHLEAPAPKKFLQNVAVKANKSTQNANTAGKKTKQKATNITIQTAQPNSGSKTDKTPTNTVSDSAQQKAPIGEQSFKMKFKTEICKFWQLDGTCEYSDQCSFAHGSHELKQRTDQPRNYKTKQCKRFHKELYCPYGPRCQFLHGEEATAAPDKKKVKLDNNVAKIDNSAATVVSYTHLLNNVIETEAATAAVSADWPEPLFEEDAASPAAAISQSLNFVEPVMETHLAGNRRLQVFANISESFGETLPISLE